MVWLLLGLLFFALVLWALVLWKLLDVDSHEQFAPCSAPKSPKAPSEGLVEAEAALASFASSSVGYYAHHEHVEGCEKFPQLFGPVFVSVVSGLVELFEDLCEGLFGCVMPLFWDVA